MIGNYVKALEDARSSVQIDPSLFKVRSLSSFYCQLLCLSLYVLQGHMREGKCHLAMGELAAALNCFHRAAQIEPKNQAAKDEVISNSNHMTIV